MAPDIPTSTNIAIGGSFREAKTLLRNNLALTRTAVYACSSFITINNGAYIRNRLAAFDTGFGYANSCDPNVNNTVNVLLPVGNYMYIGGAFTTIDSGETTRNYGAAVDVIDGTVLYSWNPNINDRIINGIIYAG